MVHAIAECDHREHQQRRDLNDVNGDGDRGGPGHAPVGDVSHRKREHNADSHHERRARIGGIHEVWPERPSQISAQDPHHRDHHAGIDPVVEVRAPTDDELGKAGVAPRLVVVQEGLLREVVGTARAGIQLRQFRVTYGGCQTKQQSDEDAQPHRRGGNARGCLNKKGQPEKGTGCDQRHGVHR